MLKLELDKLDGLDDSVKSFYEEKDGKFRLKVDGVPDVSGLKNKVDQLLTEKKEADRKAKEAAEAAEAERQAALAKSGDIDALRQSYEAKLTKREKELMDQLSGLQSQVHGLTVGQSAMAVAVELAMDGSSDVLLPHVKQRLSMEIVDGQAVTRVLDKAGKPSAMTIEELKTEFAANPAFAPIIKASKAAGGGASGGNNSGGGAPKSKASLTGAQSERVAALKARFPDLG
jgi:hypothetical protein